jgi:hypothetical protein
MMRVDRWSRTTTKYFGRESPGSTATSESITRWLQRVRRRDEALYNDAAKRYVP